MQGTQRIISSRSPRRAPRHYRGDHDHIRLAFPHRSMITPPHLQAFAPRPSPQDEMMEVQGVPIV